jgi:5-methylcytosine-specific restriction endonuclease McrA
LGTRSYRIDLVEINAHIAGLTAREKAFLCRWIEGRSERIQDSLSGVLTTQRSELSPPRENRRNNQPVPASVTHREPLVHAWSAGARSWRLQGGSGLECQSCWIPVPSVDMSPPSWSWTTSYPRPNPAIELSNVQPLCKPCHSRKTAGARYLRWRML